MNYSLIFSCEHAGNQVPEEYQSLFNGHSEVLQSHRGWDPGAWLLATFLSKQLDAPLFGCHTTRLLIEPNRSLDNGQLFSEFTDSLSPEIKGKLMQDIYYPYREKLQMTLKKLTPPILHLSIHSFTPIWNQQERKTDIGILFDPSRELESSFSKQLKINLTHNFPGFQIDFNEPYKGTDDGFTTWLRSQYSDKEYAGIEIEVNQKFASNLSAISTAFAKSIEAIR